MKKKKYIFYVVLFVVSIFCVGCGSKKNEQNYTQDTIDAGASLYEQAKEEENYMSEGIQNENHSRYEKAMDEILVQKKSFDMSRWEGDTIWDKYASLIMYYFGTIYGFIKAYYIPLVIINAVVGVFIYICSIKNKALRRFGLFNIACYLNILLTLIVVLVGIFNNSYIG